MLWVDPNFEWYEDAMVFPLFICVFCLEFRTDGKKGHLDENDFRHSHDDSVVWWSGVPFWRQLDHGYVQSSLPTIARQIDNSIFKDILQLRFISFTKIRACTSKNIAPK